MSDRLDESVVRRMVGEGMTDEAIGTVFDVTRNTISRFRRAHGIERMMLASDADLDRLYAGRRYDE